MISEDYVSFEVANLLKEKGFNEPVGFVYSENGELMKLSDFGVRYLLNSECDDYPYWQFPFEGVASIVSSPTIQMAMKWLREKYGLFINLYPEFGDVEIVWNPGDFEEDMIGYKITIVDLNYGELKYKTLIEHNYEEACETAIKYCLENLI